MSLLWTPDHERAFIEENYAFFLERLSLQDRSSQVAALPFREALCWTRGYLLAGELQRAESILESQKGLASDLEEKVFWLLTQAYLSRRRYDWGSAEGSAQEALRLLSESKVPIERADRWRGEALFALGFCQVEVNKLYLGLHTYQTGLDLAKISNHRRTLLRLNMAWVLWDLGMIENMQSVVSALPDDFAWRPRIALSLLNLTAENLRRALKFFESGYAEQPPPELGPALIYLLEAALILKVPLDPLHEIAKRLKQSHQALADDVLTTVLKILADLCEDRAISLQVDDPSHHWRDRLTYGFIALLVARKRGLSADLAAQQYLQNLQPALEFRGLRTPLIPSLGADQRRLLSQWGWARELEQFMGWQPSASQPAKLNVEGSAQSSPYELQLSSGHLAIFFEGKLLTSLDFRSSSVTLKFLQALQASGLNVYDKSVLHLYLTKTKYHPVLHDARLYKIVKRLTDRLAEHGFDNLMGFAGDGRLYIYFQWKPPAL